MTDKNDKSLLIMNKITKFSKMMTGLAIGLTLMLVDAPKLKAQETYFKTGLLSTNLTALTINPSTTNSTLGGELTLRSGVKLFPGRGIAVGANFIGGSANVTNTVKVKFQLSIDGTNYQTADQALVWNITPQGTANVKAVKIYTLSDVDNARYFRLLSVENTTTNASATVVLTNITYSVGY